MPSAFTHDPQITVPGSSTDNAVVIFDGTAGTGFGNSTILVDSGGNGRIGIAADTNVITLTSGVVTIAGTVAATTLTGAGAGITALAAANITASGTLPALNGAALTALSAANITASGTLPALVGTALTALDASNLSTGTVNVARIAAASLTASGIAELATTAEIDTGDDTGRVITPKALADSNFGERVIQMVVVDFATDLAVAASGKFWFHVPSTLDGYNIVEVHAEVITAPTGSTIIIDLYNLTHTGGDLDILSTNLTINAGETGSDTATAAVINTSNDHLATNDVIRVDIDQVGSSTAGAGLIVTMVCRLP